MDHTPQARNTVKRACLATALIAGIGYALLSVLLYPLYIQLDSNVAYTDTILTDFLYLLTDGEMLNVAICILCYPFTLYAIWRTGLKKSLPVVAVFASIDLLRFVVNFFMTAVTDGALPDSADFLAFDLPYMAGNYGLEMLLYACVILCAVLCRMARIKSLQADSSHGDVPHPLDGLLPLGGLFALKNPFLLSAFLSGLVLFLFRFSAHFINGLYEAVAVTNIALPLFLLTVAVDLVLDLLVGCLLYFSILYFASQLHRKGY